MVFRLLHCERDCDRLVLAKAVGIAKRACIAERERVPVQDPSMLFTPCSAAACGIQEIVDDDVRELRYRLTFALCVSWPLALVSEHSLEHRDNQPEHLLLGRYGRPLVGEDFIESD